jgi:hypothetical protein
MVGCDQRLTGGKDLLGASVADIGRVRRGIPSEGVDEQNRLIDRHDVSPGFGGDQSLLEREVRRPA